MTETLRSVLAEVAATISAVGCEEARRRARQVVTSALGVSSSELLVHPERELAERQAARIRWIAKRVLACEPLSRVLGRREFWGLDLALSVDTLDPRPDSEIVVEAVLRRLPGRDAKLRLLDLGTGTGCLLLALLSELPEAIGFGIDIAAGAATTARSNAAALGLASRARFIVGDWCQPMKGRFSAVVVNPPYVARRAFAELPQSVFAYDPPRALDGGIDGLEAYRVLGPQLRAMLTADGIFAAEVAFEKAEAVAQILHEDGIAIDTIERDLAGIARCVIGRPMSARPLRGTRQAKKILECSTAPFRVASLASSAARLQGDG